jgi:DNA recombination protein RmuC
MVWFAVLINILVIAAMLAIAFWWLKSQFPHLARTALKGMGEDFLGLARRELELERTKGRADLEGERKGVEMTVKALEKKLEDYEKLIRGFESDRDQKYGRLEGGLGRVIQETQDLKQATANLAAVLGNARLRGQWGQKMADDILRSCGLRENTHYLRETEIGTGRPDYTFLLPDDHCLFMDVKFPLDNYLKLVNAREEDRPAHREAFLRDIREHLREMERRDYLAQSDRVVDYLLIFIPNEQVYGLVNEWEPGLLDNCLQKKVILCGPSTLYAVIRIIWQAWQHYHYTQTMKDIVKVIQGFLQDYRVFQRRFEELGGALEKASGQYEEIRSKSYKRLEQRIQRVEEYRKGQGIPEVSGGTDVLMVESASNAGGEEP